MRKERGGLGRRLPGVDAVGGGAMVGKETSMAEKQLARSRCRRGSWCLGIAAKIRRCSLVTRLAGFLSVGRTKLVRLVRSAFYWGGGWMGPVQRAAV